MVNIDFFFVMADGRIFMIYEAVTPLTLICQKVRPEF